jgi:hypothetical protein
MFCKWIHEFNWLNSRVSVREFTGLCKQIWCVATCLPWNHKFFTWWHVPVKLYQFWPSMTCVKLVQNSWQQAEHVYSRKYTWKQVGAVPMMNQYDMCQLVQKWFLDCWVWSNMSSPNVGLLTHNFIRSEKWEHFLITRVQRNWYMLWSTAILITLMLSWSAYPNNLYRYYKWFKTPQPECCVESASRTIYHFNPEITSLVASGILH